MAVTERPRSPRELDLEAEQDVDFRRYWNAVLARWWLPALGLVAGILAGYALALGGGDVYRAEATLYLGQPFSPTGGAPVPGLATNPSTVGEIVHNDGVVDDVSPYVRDKIAAIKERIDSDERELTSIDRRLRIAQQGLQDALGNRGLGVTERLLLVSTFNSTISFGEQRRGVVQTDLLEAQQALSLAENVEKPSIVERAAARKTTARSVGRSLLVGGAIGLILGILAAIFWEPAERRFRAP